LEGVIGSFNTRPFNGKIRTILLYFNISLFRFYVNGLATSENFGTNLRYTLPNAAKLLTSSLFLGIDHFSTAAIFLAAIENFSGWTMWPRYSTLSLKNAHFLRFRLTPACSSKLNTWSTSRMWASTLDENMIMSSNYTMALDQSTEASSTSIERCKGRGH
jgi:hypothetical protein